MAKEKKQNWNIWKIVRILFLVFSIFCSLFFGVSAVFSGFLPGKYIFIMVLVLLIVELLLTLFLLCKNKILHVLGIILVLLSGSILLIGSGYVNRTYSVIKTIVTQKEEEEVEYLVLVLKDSIYSSFASLANTKMGILDQNNKENLMNKMKESVSVSYQEYASIGDMVYGLQLGEVQSITISSTIYNLIVEEYSDFIDLVRELEAVTVVGKAEVVQSNIEVGNSFILYISGLDTRDNTSVYQYGLSDVNILAVVNPTTHKVLLVNIPRDYYVQVHGKMGLKDKLTHAGLYGVETSKKTLEDLFNISINAYLKVNFSAVTTLVDAVDGIDVYSDIGFNSFHMKGWYVNQGMNHMNGAKALAFARERYAYASGDRHRGQNQQAVITAIINKVSQNKNYLLKYADILEAVQPYFNTNIEMEDIQGLVKEQLNTMARWNVESVSVNGTNSMNYTYSFPTQNSYVMVPTQSTIDSAKAKISSVMRGN